MAFAGGQPVKKNAEFLLIFPIYDNDGDLVTGAAALDSEISKDGGGFIDCTNEAAEIGTSGIYALTLTPTEMDADVVAIITKTTTEDAKTTATVIYTSDYQVVAMRGTDSAITSLVPITGDKDSYKADVSNLDVTVSSRATETKQDIIDGIVDDIKADLVDGGRLDLLIDAIKARTDVNATEAKQDIIDTIVDAIKIKTDNLTGDIITKTVAEVVDAVWDELKAGHTEAGSFGDYLDSKVSLIAGAAGAGAITWIYTLTEEGTGIPIADADVWVTSDEAGVNVVASGKTDQYGKVTFYLDAGTIYVWRQKSGWDFVNPDTEVVS